MAGEQHVGDLDAGGTSQVRHEPEEIVIVGGGIGGLAFACALHRVGLRAVVLEQSNKLRAEGVTIALYTNGMRVLQILGLADRFRSTTINIPRIQVYNDCNETLKTLDFSTCEGGPHEMRIVERKALLESLAGQLPEGTIRFNSRVTSIKKPQTSSSPFTDLELQDGSTYSAKVVVGFDGANSMIGSWIGLEKPKSIGELQIRGMAVFEDDHGLGELWRAYLGTGVRISFVPMTPTKVYWFVVWADYSELDWRNMTPEQVKQEALKLTQGFKSPLPCLCINSTPLETVTKNTLRHRLNTRPSDSQVVGNVTVAGDASHPTSPMLGQGGGMALEDAIILTQKLHPALVKSREMNQTAGHEVPESERIHQAFLDFHAERHERTYALTYKAAMRKVTWNSPDSVSQRLQSGNLLDHTLFDVGKLPTMEPC